MANNNYIIQKITLQVISSLLTPLQADTIFGSICWAYKYLEGEDKLTKFLNSYEDKPPLIISDGLPEDFFPKPILKPLSLSQTENMIYDLLNQKELEDVYLEEFNFLTLFTKLKEFKDLKYIPASYFLKNQEHFTIFTILRDYVSKKLRSKPDIRECGVVHSAIDRMTGRAREAKLFSTSEIFYPPGSKINIFLKTAIDWIDKIPITRIFEFIQNSGFGKKKSIGKGQLRVLESPEIIDKFYEIDVPNAFMTLSSFVPAPNDPTHGHYQPILKYGKLGGDYAKSHVDQHIGMNPFKKPIVMFGAGSIFFLDEKDENQKFVFRDYYGGLVHHIHWSELIKQYGIAFPIGLKIEN